MTWLHRFLLTLLLAACCSFSKGQANEFVFNNFLTEFESQKLFVNAIEQDNQGFIWFGTYQGLIRFDGVSYQRYLPVPGNLHSISDNKVNVLYKDADGNLWVGTRNGLNRYDYLRNDFERFLHNPGNSNSLSNNEVYAIEEDHEKNLWIGTLNGGLSKMSPQTVNGVKAYSFTNYAHDSSDASSLSSNSVFSICFDEAGNGFIGTADGLNLIIPSTSAGGKISFQHFKNNPSDAASIASNNVFKIFCDSQHNVWLISQFGMIDLLKAEEISSKRFRFQHLFPALSIETRGAIKSASMFYIDRMKNCWLSTYENGLYRFTITPDHKIKHLVNYYHDATNTRSLSDNTVHSIFESNDNSIWIGTASGVSRWNHLQEKFSVMNMAAPHFEKVNIGAITEDSNHTVWLGSSGSDTLFAIVPPLQEIRKLILADKNLPVNRMVYITCLLAAQNGDLYAGTSIGVFILEAAEKHKFIHQPGYRPSFKHLRKTSDPHSLVSNIISCIDEDATGKIWIGTGMGVNLYDPVLKKSDRVLWNKLSNDINPAYIVRHLKATNAGTVWVGTDDGLSGINSANLKITAYPNNGELPSSRISFIHESNDQQTIWLGTEQGLASFDPQTSSYKSYPSANNDLSVMAILEDAGKNLWISSQYGICKFNIQNGDSKKFTAQNGLNTNRFSETSCFATTDGCFYFGGEKGFQAFYPDSITINSTIPPVAITDFKLFNQSILGGADVQLLNDFLRSKKMQLNYDQNFFSIDFAALNYNDAEANSYAYQLVGIDKDWVIAGNNRTATYTNISPGQYTFKVRGSNNHGVWNDEGATLYLNITPPWWKTWWFYTICSIAVIAGLYSLYRYRINQIKKVFSIRSKIARDLHDDIGSTLSSISLMSQLAKDQGEHTNNEQELFETISTASKEAMELMSVIVWSVNPNNDKLSNILIRMREYSSDILEACNIELNITLEEDVKDFIIPMEKRKDFYLIFKEAVNNVAKYSQASHAVIRLFREHGKMIMTIIDDGKGFDVGKLRSGNGLVNMKDRASFIGGMLQLKSEIGKGTSIRLEMPLYHDDVTSR